MKVTLQDLTKKFPSMNKKGEFSTAVGNFNLEIPDGKLIGLLGPSGCGKSTALNMISGLLEPTSGRIFFGDDDVTDVPAESRGVGLVFQSYALYPHMTVRQNIMFPLQNVKKAARLSKEEMEKKALEAARLVQIDRLMDKKPSELSGGQQQRVAIARALVKTPKVLLLDEPLSNLDARLRLQTREELRRIQKETRVTTIFVTHDQEEAMSISDLIVVMDKGLVHQAGKPQDVYDDPADLFVAKFLGTPPINMFSGRVEKGKLYIGDDLVMNADAREGEVAVGIRPEGFVLSENGGLVCGFKSVEVMGRDISVISSHPAMEGAAIRSIIDAGHAGSISGDTVRFALRRDKVFLFDRDNGERLRFTV